MDNRIDQLSISPTMERTAGKHDFGAMLAHGIGTTGTTLGNVAGAILPGGAVISAAINRTAGQALSGGPSGAAVRGGQMGGGYGASGKPPATSSSDPLASSSGDSLEGQRELMVQNQKWTEQYLALQEDMQRESREYNTVSNILKVRHESAKTAINNIR